jgi:hypothetical protein
VSDKRKPLRLLWGAAPVDDMLETLGKKERHPSMKARRRNRQGDRQGNRKECH